MVLIQNFIIDSKSSQDMFEVCVFLFFFFLIDAKVANKWWTLTDPLDVCKLKGERKTNK